MKCNGCGNIHCDILDCLNNASFHLEFMSDANVLHPPMDLCRAHTVVFYGNPFIRLFQQIDAEGNSVAN